MTKDVALAWQKEWNHSKSRMTTIRILFPIIELILFFDYSNRNIVLELNKFKVKNKYSKLFI